MNVCLIVVVMFCLCVCCRNVSQFWRTRTSYSDEEPSGILRGEYYLCCAKEAGSERRDREHLRFKKTGNIRNKVA